MVTPIFDTTTGSLCGYSTEARQKWSSSQLKDQWSQQAPYDFTGCCAHADITYNKYCSTMLRIIGYFEHNEECQNSTLVRYPSIPLHDHIYEVTLEQLSQGARYKPRISNAIPCHLTSFSVSLLFKLKTFGGLSTGNTGILADTRTTTCQSHSTLRLPTCCEHLLVLSNPCWTLPVGCSLVHRGRIESTINLYPTKGKAMAMSATTMSLEWPD